MTEPEISVTALEEPRDLQQDSAPLVDEWKPGQLHIIGPLVVPGHPPRRVRVYLPVSFSPTEPRFGLYMFDGQNLFDDFPSFAGGWKLNETIERLERDCSRVPIAIGIDHGNEARIQELSPFDIEQGPSTINSLLDWIADTLAPRLQAELPLVPGPIGAVIGGSSMGGIASLYAHFHRRDAFGGVLAMSPSLWLADGEMVHWIAQQEKPEVSRVYIDCGVREGKGKILPLVAAVAADLTERGWDNDQLMFRPDMRGAHNERSWQRRLPKALRFFYR
jgi:predicted alpha/beta superfamily hydrolase